MNSAVTRKIVSVPTAAMGAAVTPQGNAAASTTKVYNQVAGDKELHITLSVAGGSDIADVTFVFGAWNTATTIKSGVTFAAEGFASFAEFKAYFSLVNTTITGIRMETDDVANFQSTLKLTERDPSGHEEKVTKLLSRYRVPVGNGYSETLEMDADDLSFVIWPGLEVVLSKIKAGSQIDIYLAVTGWNKSKDLNPLKASII